MTQLVDPKAARKELAAIRDGQEQDRFAEVRMWEAITGTEPGKPLMHKGEQIGFMGNTFRDRFPYIMASVDDALRLADSFGVEVRGLIRDKEKPGYWRAVCIRDGKAVSGHGRLMGAAITVAVVEAVAGEAQ